MVDDYGVDPARVCVRPYPVADVHQQVRAESEQRRRTASDDELVRMVFIGGDFERKGGPWLVDGFADDGLFFRTVPSDSLQARAIAEAADQTGAVNATIAFVDDAWRQKSPF